MKHLFTTLAGLGVAALVLATAPTAATAGSPWSASVPFTNVVASTPTTGAG